LVFHFSIRLVAGAVEMWESRLPLARFPKSQKIVVVDREK